MKKLSQHGTTWNSQVMMLSVMVRTFVTLCRDNVCGLMLRYEIVHKEYGILKIKEEVYNSIFCGYIGK